MQEFDERIEESRKNASEIKRALIEPTKKLLKAANNLDLRAKTEVEEALTQAIRSLNAIEEGNNTIANAEMVSMLFHFLLEGSLELLILSS